MLHTRTRWACLALLAATAWALGAPASEAREAKSKSKATAKVDLNTATEKELEDLPGVGAATAEKIMAGRPYASVADLEKAGVSAKTIAEIKPLVTVHKSKATTTTAKTDSGPAKEPKTSEKATSGKKPAVKTTTSKVDVNSASEKELEDLPGVGPATAQKIIAGRPYASVAELEKAGVTAKTLEEIKPLVVAKKAKASAAPTAHPAEKPTPTKATAGNTTTSAGDEEVEARTPPRPGLVWVNTESKVFHIEGDRWYGKTKKGEWMTEAEALKAGYRAVKEPAPKPKE